MHPYPEALAAAEHASLNAARLGCPLAMALADIRLVRARNAALVAQPYDPARAAFEEARRDAGCQYEYANS